MMMGMTMVVELANERSGKAKRIRMDYKTHRKI